MASCPSCQQKVSVLFYSFRPSVLLGNVFRSPAGRIFTCRNCGAQLTMTPSSFELCQVAFVVLVIPSAIGFARLQVWLVNSVGIFQRFAAESPGTAVFLLWIAPTLVVALSLYSVVAGQLVEMQRVDG
jgi:uncharacterized protein (DUF983 family)